MPTDRQAIKAACRQFLENHQPILKELDTHLQEMMGNTEPKYAQAYKPWLKSIRDICNGVFLMSKGIPLPDPAGLLEALKMFTFEGALQLLHDLCISCKLALKTDWVREFRQDIDIMLFAVAAQNRTQQQGQGR